MVDSNESRQQVSFERLGETCAQTPDLNIGNERESSPADGLRMTKGSTTDADAVKRMTQALKATGVTALLDLVVTVANGAIVIQGKVPSYYAKQLAQAALLPLRGVLEVRNEVQVSSMNGQAD